MLRIKSYLRNKVSCRIDVIKSFFKEIVDNLS